MGCGSNTTNSHCFFFFLLRFSKFSGINLHLLYAFRTVSRDFKWLFHLVTFTNYGCFSGKWVSGAYHATAFLSNPLGSHDFCFLVFMSSCSPLPHSIGLTYITIRLWQRWSQKLVHENIAASALCHLPGSLALGEASCLVMRTGSPVVKSPWQRTEASFQKAAQTCQACKWAILGADPPICSAFRWLHVTSWHLDWDLTRDRKPELPN